MFVELSCWMEVGLDRGNKLEKQYDWSQTIDDPKFIYNWLRQPDKKTDTHITSQTYIISQA